MEMLKLALKARLPSIWVSTDDLLHVRDVLQFYCGEPVILLEPGDKPNISGGNYYLTSANGLPVQKLYRMFKAENKTLIYVNTEKSVLHFDAGALVPPKEMILNELKKYSKDAESLLSAFGGVSLKDVYEIVRLTLERDGVLTVSGCNRTRQMYVSKLKGIYQVEAAVDDFYTVPKDLKEWCDVNLPFFRHNIHPSLTPKGLLLDGPPGTGKTMAAKYIADSLGVPLYRLDIGTMKGKYVGDSEGNLNAALAQIDQAAPCVVLMDEVEKVFSTQSSDSSGVTSSMLGALLWWLQEHKSNVFIVMTTNNAKVLPPELYREGRIDNVLTFNGLQSIAEVKSLTNKIIESFAKSLPQLTKELASKAFSAVVGKMELLFDAQNAIPHAKVVEETRRAVKNVLFESGV